MVRDARLWRAPHHEGSQKRPQPEERRVATRLEGRGRFGGVDVIIGEPIMGAKDDPILIVGGGLGGLTTALALARKGWRVQVLEQAAEIEPIGYGIQLGPNVFHMLERLGLMEAVLAHSHFPGACVWLDAEDGT